MTKQMRNKITVHGSVDGDGGFNAMQSLKDALERLKGCAVVVYIEEMKRKRSNNQNRYYWGVVVSHITAMMRDAGNDVDHDDVHDFLKAHVGKLAYTVFTPDGGVFKAFRSSKLSTQEFEDYMEKCRAWAAQFGCVIPLPNEGEGYVY